MGYDVCGQTCLVTGSARGIGKEYAKRLLNKGAKVCISDVDEMCGMETTEELMMIYGKENLTFIKLDVTIDDHWDQALDHCKKTFGSNVQVLVNNAGVPANLSHQEILDVNIKATVNGTKKTMERIAKAEGGRVINTSSMTGVLNGLMMEFACAPYDVAKWGAVAFTRQFETCTENNPWIVNKVKSYALCPWYVDTRMARQFKKDAPDLYKKTTRNIRLLKTEEVGDVFDQALELDKNGAVYAIMPDCPTISCPELNGKFFYQTLWYAKLRQLLSPSCRMVGMMDVFKIGIVCFYMVGIMSGILISSVI